MSTNRQRKFEFIESSLGVPDPLLVGLETQQMVLDPNEPAYLFLYGHLSP